MRTLWALTFGMVLGLLAGSSHAQPSLQARLDAAAAGDTVVVEGGVHEGPFVIDTSLVLQGTGRPHLRGTDSTHVVTITASDVTVQGFRITDSGTQLAQDHAGVMVKGRRATIRNNHLADVLHGIYVEGKDRTVIANNRIDGPPTVARRVTPEDARRYDDCSVPPGGGTCEVPLVSAQRGNGIHLWNAAHSTITHNTIHHTRDGTYFSHSDHNYTAHNTIRDVRYGLHFMYSDDNTFEHNVFTDNASGSALMYSSGLTVRHNVFRNNRSQRGYGLLLQTMTAAEITDNRLTENGTGVYLENSSRLTVRRNVVAANYRGFRITGSSMDNRFTGNLIRGNLNTAAEITDNRLTENGTGVYLENSSRLTVRKNVVAANYRGFRITGSSMDNRFTGNLIRGNLNTAAVSGMSATNEWQVDGRGNYWGPRGLLDINADGVSELPHRTVDLLGSRRASFPYVDLLVGSPGLALLAEALARVAGTGVPTITDPAPLTRPPVPLERAGGGAVPILTLGLALLTVGWTALRQYTA